MLQLNHKIVPKRFGKFVRFYKNSSTYNDREQAIFSHLRDEIGMKLLRTIGENPGITSNRLSEMFHMEKSTLYARMRRLIRDRIVIFEDDGYQRRYFLSDDVETLVLRPEGR